MPTPREPNLAAARSLIAALESAGLRHAFVSPGSRSTPLVLALAERSAIEKFVVTDERSAAFAALGASRESGAPSLLVCTSGTAAANYLPAVVEAAQALVPLLVVTADRPGEARDVRAAQTIEQRGIYREFVRWEVDLPVPGRDVDHTAYLTATGLRAWATAVTRKGPVHLNIGFREPLYQLEDFNVTAASTDVAPTVFGAAAAAPSPDALVAVLKQCRDKSRGLIVCGSGLAEAGSASVHGNDALATVVDLARTLGWPIVADSLSGLRGLGQSRAVGDVVIDAYDLCLRDAAFVAEHHPQVILHLGQIPASKSLLLAQRAWSDAQHIVIASHDWPDPEHRAAMFVMADPAQCCGELLKQLRADVVLSKQHAGVSHTASAARESSSAETGEHATAASNQSSSAKPGAGATDSTWMQSWTTTNHALRTHLDRAVQQCPANFPGRIAAELTAALPKGACLQVGNSMPVRDIDTFVGCSPLPCDVVSNRGANGIDGVVSTAIGRALVGRRPVALLIGDQSFLHDLSALAWPALRNAPLVIVVANDDGGGIFEQLPQRELGELFQTYFAAPHGLSPAKLAEAAGIASVRLGDDIATLRATLKTAFSRAQNEQQPTVIEVTSNREQNRELRTKLVSEALGATLGAGAGATAAIENKAKHSTYTAPTPPAEQPSWQSPAILTNDRGRIAYRIRPASAPSEKRPPLVALHGFLGCSSSWSSILNAWPDSPRVLAPDLPGHGSSDFGIEAFNHTLQSSFELIDAMLEAESIETFDLLGYSMGGRVALRYALQHPKRINRLILESTNWGIDDPIERRARLQKDEAAASRLEEDFRSLGVQSGMSRFVESWERLPLFADQREWPEQRKAEQRAHRTSNHPERIAASLRGMGAGADASVREKLNSLTVPTLLLCGSLDTKYCEAARAMNAKLPTSQLVCIEGEGHNLHAGATQPFLEAISAFLNTAPTKKR